MEAKEAILQNRGMNQDSSISKSTNEFAFENYGIRITGEQDNTLLSVTNEKGPSLTCSLTGTYLGYSILGKYLIIFTSTGKNTDYIYKYTTEGGLEELYSGNLNFQLDHPIETLSWYESEDIQKVYWIDGYNYTRFINVVGNIKPEDDYQFDFSTHINKLPKVNVEKDYTQSGMFNQGTIQYFITYYNKYGAETPIVWQSSLHYISFENRGAKADENINCAFNIDIKDLDPHFDYVRIYSAQRTDNNSPIIAKLIADIAIPSQEEIDAFENPKKVTKPDGTTEIVKSKVFKLRFTDMGTSGAIIDPNILYYIGGMSVIADTMTQKDGTLFLGNLNITETKIDDALKTFFKSRISNLDSVNPNAIREAADVSFSNKRIQAPRKEGYYAHTQQINHSQYNVATFKNGEIYRFAIQFMTKTGEWVTPIWIGDKLCNVAPELNDEGIYYLVANAVYNWPPELTKLVKDKYTSYRLLMAETSAGTRSILAQGVVNPTLFNYYERFTNSPHSIASWNFRPKNSNINHEHLQSIGTQFSDTAELQGIREELLPMFDVSESDLLTYKYYNLIIGVDPGTEMVYKLVLYNLPDDKVEDALNHRYKIPKGEYKVISSGREDKSSWNKVIDAVYSRLEEDCETYIKSTEYSTIKGVPITKSQMPSRSEIKDILSWQFGTKAWGIVASALIAVAGVVLSVITWGTASAPAVAGATVAITAIMTAISTAISITVTTLCISVAVLGTAMTAKAIIDTSEATEIEKKLAKKGWFYAGQVKDITNPTDGFISMFEDMDGFPRFDGTNNGSFWLTGGRITFKSSDEVVADSKKEQYYIDESIVTVHSPEIEDNYDIINNNQALDFRIIGIVPIDAVSTDYLLEPNSAGFNKLSDIIKHDISFNKPLQSNDTEGLLSGFLYQDSYLPEQELGDDKKVYRQTSVVPYKTFLWNREASLSLGGNHKAMLVDDKGEPIDYNPAGLKHKVFANIRYASETKYFPYTWTADYGVKPIKVFNSDSVTAMDIPFASYKNKYYFGNYDTLVAFKDKYEILTLDNYNEVEIQKEKYYEVKIPYGYGSIKMDGDVPVYNNGKLVFKSTDDSLMITDPVRIKYKSTPHAVVVFNKKDYYQPILPIIKGEQEHNIQRLYLSKYNSKDLYTEVGGDPELSDGVVESVIRIIAKPIYKGAVSVEESIPILDLTAFSYDKLGYYKYFDPETKKEREGISASAATGDYDVWSKIRSFMQSLVKEGGDEYNRDNSIRAMLNNISIALRVKYKNENNKVVTKWFTLIDYNITKMSNIDMPVLNIPDNSYLKVINCINKEVNTKAYEELNYKILVSGLDAKRYNGHPYYIQEQLNTPQIPYPYLWLGEVYKTNFNYQTLYGGYSDSALQAVKWQICSSNTNIETDIDITWGDTYFQRWDCLKTYPFTEEDANGIVDILSFMVETHINLDGRCDINRGTSNILNARPTNWNLINPSYTQANNILEYNILDKKFDLSKFKNQITWSLTKLDTADVDTWTNINLANILSLDGSKGTLTKLITVNDSIIAFQDTAISSINFNNRTQLSTEQGTPVELANSGKVEGYTIITDSLGCNNKWSICNAAGGIYFIDDRNKSFMRLSKGSIESLSTKHGMSKFFRENAKLNPWIPRTGAIKVSYDALTQDVYINSDTFSLLYNEKLDAFTSFMPYEGISDVFMFDGKSYAILPKAEGTDLFEMFAGKYNINYNGKQSPYRIVYRVNPEPYSDKTFTNLEYIADVIIPQKSVDEPEILDTSNPFDTLKIWNEYQFGSCTLSEKVMPSDLKRKFRFWRANIPRDEKSKFKLDRIRNPWCYLSLSKDTTNTNKMVFHQVAVKYFK